MANIRINALPEDDTPNANDVIPLDGATTRRATIQEVVEIGRPAASQAEAETGTEATKVMTPLTVRQATNFLLPSTSLGRSLLNGASQAAIRAAIDAQQQFDSLDAIGALTPATDTFPYFTDGTTAALGTVTSFARTLLDDADAATAQQTLGLEPNVDVQPWSQILEDIADGDVSPVSRPVLITTDYTRETYDSEIILASTATATRTLTIPEGLPVSTAITLRNDTDPDDEYNLIVQVGDGVDEPIFGTDDGIGIVLPQTAVTIVKVSTVSWRVSPPLIGTDPGVARLEVIDPTGRNSDAYDPDQQVNSAFAFGAVADGSTDDTAAIQALFDAFPDGTVIIPPGNYAVGDVTISNKGAGNSGAFRVIANGAVFVGTGKIIVDGCKRLQLFGFDAPGHSLAMRGMWYSETFGCRFREHLIGDAAGTFGFTSVYWNNHHNGLIQRVRVINDAAPTVFFFNANWYHGVSLRGDAAQGFSTTSDYGIIIDGAGSVQNLVFYGGDFSEHAVAIYSLESNAPAEVNILFHAAYFDQVCPQRGTPRDSTRIVTRDCQMTNSLPVASALRAATQGGASGHRVDRSVSYQPFMPFNLVPNGNLSQDQAAWAGAEGPILSSNSATITDAAGGPFGRYLNINQALTTSNQVRIRAVTTEAGRHTMQLIMRNADSGSRTIRISFGGSPALFETVTILNSDWTFVTLTSEDEFSAAENADILILTSDGTAFNVDVAMMAIYYGENGPLAMAQHPQRDKRDYYWATQYRVGDGTTASRPIMLSGTGSPEGVVAAPRGSQYMRTDGGAGTCFYVKETVATNTGWVAK